MYKEKVLALQLILEDIRGNWGWDLQERVDKAKEICEGLSHKDDDFKTLLSTIEEFKAEMEEEPEWVDGRFFRNEFPCGYENMSMLHGLNNTYKDKSDQFKADVECLTYPDLRFSDWK